MQPFVNKMYHSWEWRHMSVTASQTTGTSTVCSKNIQAKMKQKLKQRITDPFRGESTSHWWIPWIPPQCGKCFHIMASTCLDSFVLCDYDINVVKAYQSFTPGAFPSSWQQIMQSAWGKCWFIVPYFLNHWYNHKWYILNSLMTWITNLNYTLPGLNTGTS